MDTAQNKSVLWHYNAAYSGYMAGLISEEEWQEYCTEMLMTLMEEHADVFERLKVRGE